MLFFYELAHSYNWLETKKEKMHFLDEIEQVILPKLGIEPMHRKSLIRKLRFALIVEVVRKKPGRKNTYTDLDKHHLIQIWKLSCYPCSKRLKVIFEEWLLNYNCSWSQVI